MQEIEWGETPWDNMSKEELLLRVFKLYKAAESARCCLRISRASNPDSIYWTEGSGGKALNMLDQAMSDGLILDDANSERLWKGFFRNALPLLFKNSEWDWMVCEKCKQWLCSNTSGEIQEKCFCGNNNLRPIKWKDFYSLDLEKTQ